MSETVHSDSSSAGTAKVEFSVTMTVSDLAKQKLDEFLGADKPLGEHLVRISVQPGGCSGASYGMEFATELADGEMEFEANGVRIAMLPQNAPLLNGLNIDFLDEMMGGGFKIHNPNATSTCGCGKSFSA